MEQLFSLEVIASLLTLTALEIVLGIDNIIFLSIISARLPKAQQRFARRLGLGLALAGRIGFLFSITWIMRLTEPLVTLEGFVLSWRDIILLAGGLFLIYKATLEIHIMIEGSGEGMKAAAPLSLRTAILQIAVLDVVFALDSMITAVGLADLLWVMIAANVIAMAVMLLAAEPVAAFIERHQSLKMLALSFLLMVGAALVADGTHFHIPRNYIYAALAFSCATEFLNILAFTKRKKRESSKP